MRYVLLIAAALLVAGCTMTPKVNSATERSISFSRVDAGGEAQAMAMAEEHCAKYGREPRISQRQAFWLIIDCVK